MELTGVKTPPHDQQAEQSVLGALLIDPTAVTLIAGFLRPTHFYHKEHELIYTAVISLFESQRAIDAVTIVDELKGLGGVTKIGGNKYLSELINTVPTSAHIEHYARIIVQNYIKRKLIELSSRTVEKAFAEKDNVRKLLDEVETELYGLSQSNSSRDFMELKDVLVERLEEIDERSKTGELRGVTTGFQGLDNILYGLHNSNLIILAARPGVGKTTFAVNIGFHVAGKLRKPVGIFSLEMSKEELVERLLVAESGVEGWRLRTGKLTDTDYTSLTEAMGNLSDSPIYIDDTPGATILEMRTKARRLKAEKGLGLLIVDYLQLADAGGKYESRTVEVSTISKGLKNLARELQIPVLCLSQLNRTVENRTTRKPQLSDLRESGAIEQDADVVMFLYQEDEGEDLVNTNQRNIKLDVAKHRHGGTGTVDLLFRGDKVSFFSVERQRGEDDF